MTRCSSELSNFWTTNQAFYKGAPDKSACPMPECEPRIRRPVGRPRKYVAREQLEFLRSQGLSLRKIARTMGLGYGTVRRVFRGPAQLEKPSNGIQ